MIIHKQNSSSYFSIAYCLFLIFGFICGTVPIWFGLTELKHGWLLMDKAVKIREGEEYLIEAYNEKTQSEFEISIVVQRFRQDEHNKILCLLGIKLSPDILCKENPNVIDVEWTVFKNGQKIRYSREFGSWGTGISHTNDEDILNAFAARTIGEIHISRYANYIFKLKFNKNGLDLDQYNPVIQIHGSNFEYVVLKRFNQFSVILGVSIYFLIIILSIFRLYKLKFRIPLEKI